MPDKKKEKRVIYTIGHSTHEMEEFIDLLKTYDIGYLVDVRTLPGSKRVPQFNQENLKPALNDSGISYQHIKLLGGLRNTTKASVNMGWRNKSFRGFADYMQTDEFHEGLEKLLDIAAKNTTAIMCAEAVPWRCHRSLIGDALLVRDFEVKDIFSKKKAEDHKLTSFARVKGLNITYPSEE